MKLAPMIAAATVMLALTMPVTAKSLVTGASVPQILSAAQAYGEATLTTQANGDPQISGKIDDITYHVLFRNCTDNTDCEDLNFYVGFLDLKPSLEVINDWNYSKRFSRAYLDEDGDACVEMDIDLVEGVTSKYLDSQFALWEMVMAQFAEHIGY